MFENRIMYLRFVLTMQNPDTGVEEGVFSTAYALRREGALSSHERDELGILLRWFGDNLSVPARFNRTKSKGYYRRATKGISWFKSLAGEHIARMYRISAILEIHGHHVSMIKTSKPGYVVYQDEHQIVAEPFNDLRRLKR